MLLSSTQKWGNYTWCRLVFDMSQCSSFCTGDGEEDLNSRAVTLRDAVCDPLLSTLSAVEACAAVSDGSACGFGDASSLSGVEPPPTFSYPLMAEK